MEGTVMMAEIFMLRLEACTRGQGSGGHQLAVRPHDVAGCEGVLTGQRCPRDLASTSRRLFFARVSNLIQTRARDRLRFINTGRFKSPDSRAPEDLADCDSDGRQIAQPRAPSPVGG